MKQAKRLLSQVLVSKDDLNKIIPENCILAMYKRKSEIKVSLRDLDLMGMKFKPKLHMRGIQYLLSIDCFCTDATEKFEQFLAKLEERAVGRKPAESNMDDEDDDNSEDMGDCTDNVESDN